MSSRSRRKPMAQMNVVPYIDVMLVLLVIFMVTAPMMQAGVEIDAPRADAAPLTTDNQQEPLIISVDQMGNYYLPDGSGIQEPDIGSWVTEHTQAGNAPVYVRADAGVEYRYVMAAMVAIQKAGARKIGLMADPPADDTLR
ncbi:MAG TPA: ExbD/TolR family protein [Thiolinea sp.]|nr:ExbD/TolR family protein [Thiolinea sp.]